MALEIIILAAGLGTRMKSDQPKVMHKAAGNPILYYPLKASINLDPQMIRIVVGHEKSSVFSEKEVSSVC